MDLLVSYACRMRRHVKNENFHDLKQISQDAARDAFVHQNAALLDTSVVAYSFVKLSQKSYVLSNPAWRTFRRNILEKLKQVCSEEEPAAPVVRALLEEVYSLSASIGRFAQNVVEKARLKAAAQMYAHGASLLQAAEMSGAPLAEVSAYIGATRIPEKYETMTIAERMKTVRSLF